MWYRVAAILSAWAVVEDWEVADGSLNSTERALQVEFLFVMMAQTAAGTVGWSVLIALKANNMDSVMLLC